MSEDNKTSASNEEDIFDMESESVSQIMAALKILPKESRLKVLNSVLTLIGDGPQQVVAPSVTRQSTVTSVQAIPGFSDSVELSPKEFLLEKQPKTEVERVACLGFYLAHYRDMPQFKTLDVSKLNTEAAQRKLGNPAQTMGNAVKYGYLVSATKGTRQLSAHGEQFVQALPDREAAKQTMESERPKRKAASKKKSKKKN